MDESDFGFWLYIFIYKFLDMLDIIEWRVYLHDLEV